MDYEKAYQETLAEFYILTTEINKFKKDHTTFDVIFDFNTLITDYETKLYDMELAKPKNEKETNRLKALLTRLMKIYNSYAYFYYSAQYNERKYVNSQKELLELRMKVTELTERNKILEQIDKL